MDLTPLLRIGAAAVLSLPIGINREMTGKPAGIRTHLLISTATAALGWLSVASAEVSDVADPTRIASQVVAGVGFLGAGVILSVRGRVHGVTTATAVFAAAALGLVMGMGFPLAASGLALIGFAALWPLDVAKTKVLRNRLVSEATLSVTLSDARALAEMQRIVQEADLEPRSLSLTSLGDGVANALITVRGTQAAVQSLVERLAECDTVMGRPGVYGTSGSS